MPVKSNNLCLSIAGMVISLNCQDSHLIDELADRYHGFIQPGSPPGLLTLQQNMVSHPATLIEAELKAEGSRFLLSGRSAAGWIDPQAGTGMLQTGPLHPAEDADYFLRVAVALLAFRAGGFLFHAASIIHHGLGYLFYGHSGSGKTTVSRHSRDDQVLNDDLVVILPEDNGWQVHATPFWNPTQIRPRAGWARLKAMFQLVQDRRVFLEKVSIGRTTADMAANIPMLMQIPVLNEQLLTRCLDLATGLPNYHLHFLPDSSFWTVIDQGLL